MPARGILVLLLAPTLLASALVGTPAHAKPCKNGRFLVKHGGTRYFDAVTLAGGRVSTEDEMFILLGGYYLVP